VADLDERVSAKALAFGLPKQAWRTITWRDGSADPLRSRFARVRVRTAPMPSPRLPAPSSTVHRLAGEGARALGHCSAGFTSP
jgi:hypothetical protein